MCKISLTGATFFAIGSLLAINLKCVSADAAGLGIPDYNGQKYPVASTFYWFSSVEVAICYNPQGRVASIKGQIDCTHQGKYDIDNNTWTLPQTCVALQPLGGPLSTAVHDSCKLAKGIYNVITPASSNEDGSQAYKAIQDKSSGGTSDAPDSNDQLAKGDGGGGFLGGLGGLLHK
nr:Pep1 protein [Ustilago esculenta]